MRKHGFTGGLADDWNTRFTDEWVFEFTRYAVNGDVHPLCSVIDITQDAIDAAWVCRRGCANTFVLHCSLQAASGKMFVHAREAGGSANAHCLGLLLSKYIPEPGPLASSSWQGLPAEAEALEEMFATHIARPLIAAAVPGPVRAPECPPLLPGALLSEWGAVAFFQTL